MKHYRWISLRKRERKFRIYGPVFLSVFLLVFFYAMLLTSNSATFRWVFVPVFYSILSWESVRLVIIFCRKKFPGIRNTGKRISLMLVTGLPLAAVIAWIDHQFTFLLNLYEQITAADYFFITGLNILCSAVAISIYESHYYLHEWRRLFIESENMKKQNSNSQFQFLREQIKPHFLFNSLNTLSALITTNPVKAELYVEEMASVYRYLLSKNEKELTTLKEELSFLNSYLLLLRVRFEDSLIVELQADHRYDDHLLPPFVLQLLIENAVKHNIISSDQPLTIKIYQDDKANLYVENNMQLKTRTAPSEQKGLANILSRYDILGKKQDLLISREEGVFKVSIPLLEEIRYASAYY